MTAQEQAYKDFEAKLLAHLKAMDKAGKANFNDWLACQQALLQMRQTHAVEGIHDILKTHGVGNIHDILIHWYQNGFPVRSMNPFSEL